MKVWMKPQLEELKISKTEQGQHLSNNFDEIRVDQNGNYWASFQSGEDSKPDIGGNVEVH